MGALRIPTAGAVAICCLLLAGTAYAPPPSNNGTVGLSKQPGGNGRPSSRAGGQPSNMGEISGNTGQQGRATQPGGVAPAPGDVAIPKLTPMRRDAASLKQLSEFIKMRVQAVHQARANTRPRAPPQPRSTPTKRGSVGDKGAGAVGDVRKASQGGGGIRKKGELGKRGLDRSYLNDTVTVEALWKRAFDARTPGYKLLGWHGTRAYDGVTWNNADGVLQPYNDPSPLVPASERLGRGIYISNVAGIASNYAGAKDYFPPAPPPPQPYYDQWRRPVYPPAPPAPPPVRGMICEVYVNQEELKRVKKAFIPDWFLVSSTENRYEQLLNYLRLRYPDFSVGCVMRMGKYFNGGPYGRSFGWQMLIPNEQACLDLIRVVCYDRLTYRLDQPEIWDWTTAYGDVSNPNVNRLRDVGGNVNECVIPEPPN